MKQCSNCIHAGKRSLMSGKVICYAKRTLPHVDKFYICNSYFPRHYVCPVLEVRYMMSFYNVDYVG